jgi:hypothetical protein
MANATTPTTNSCRFVFAHKRMDKLLHTDANANLGLALERRQLRSNST